MTTVGVSIPIPAPWGTELQDYRRSYGDPLADGIPTHLTLLPPTGIDPEALPDIRDHLSAIAARMRAFTMLLRGTGTFLPISPVVFVQVAQGVAHCELLERQVRAGPLQRALTFPYHPHVTVAHDMDAAQMDRAFQELAGFACSFDVAGFDLYVHGPDKVWRSIDTFRFGLPSDGSTAPPGPDDRDDAAPPRPEWQI